MGRGAAAGDSQSQAEPRSWGTVRDGDAAEADLRSSHGIGRLGSR